MTIVNHDHGIIFLKTRKTAGTSIELALSQVAGSDDVLTPLEREDERERLRLGQTAQNDLVPLRRYQPRDVGRLLVRLRRARFANHMPASLIRQYVGENCWRSYRKFTVERHPYERAVSMFYWQQRSGATMDILTFLQRFPPSKLSNSQMYSIAGTIVVDDIIEYDRLKESFPSLMQSYGIDGVPALSRAKSQSRRTLVPASEILGASGKRLVQAACWEDFELMEYST